MPGSRRLAPYSSPGILVVPGHLSRPRAPYLYELMATPISRSNQKCIFMKAIIHKKRPGFQVLLCWLTVFVITGVPNFNLTAQQHTPHSVRTTRVNDNTG